MTGSNGQKGTLAVTSSTKTVGQLITAINALSIGVQAQLDPNGDGIELVDTAHGSGTLSVTAGNGTTANDLHLLNGGSSQTVNGVSTQVITGSNVISVAISASDTLQSLITKINSLDAGVTASEFNNGSSTNPYQFTIFNGGNGAASELAVDTSNANFTVHETAAAQNALLQFGAPGGGGSVAASSTNTFTGLVPNLSITANAVSTTPVSLTVSSDSSQLVSAVQQFIAAYNTVQRPLRPTRPTTPRRTPPRSCKETATYCKSVMTCRTWPPTNSMASARTARWPAWGSPSARTGRSA